jgi:hypothetical protein
LFEGGFEVFDDFLGKNIRIRKVVGLFETLVSVSEDIKAGFIAVLKHNKIRT